MTIKIPALKKPTLKQLQKERSWIKSIESDNSTTKAVEIEFTTVLKEGEKIISGSEYETRLKARTDVVLGWQHRNWIEKNQDNIPELKALREKGVWYIDFPSLVVVNERGGRCVPYLHSDGKRFFVHWFYLVDGFDGNGRFGVSSKSAKSSETSSLGSDSSVTWPPDTLEIQEVQ